MVQREQSGPAGFGRRLETFTEADFAQRTEAQRRWNGSSKPRKTISTIKNLTFNLITF